MAEAPRHLPHQDARAGCAVLTSIPRSWSFSEKMPRKIEIARNAKSAKKPSMGRVHSYCCRRRGVRQTGQVGKASEASPVSAAPPLGLRRLPLRWCRIQASTHFAWTPAMEPRHRHGRTKGSFPTSRQIQHSSNAVLAGLCRAQRHAMAQKKAKYLRYTRMSQYVSSRLTALQHFALRASASVLDSHILSDKE